MLLRRFPIAAAAVCCAFLFALLVSAAPQTVDRETYARDYVQFLVLQLDQWSKERRVPGRRLAYDRPGGASDDVVGLLWRPEEGPWRRMTWFPSSNNLWPRANSVSITGSRW